MTAIAGLYALTLDNIADTDFLCAMCEEVLAAGIGLLQYRDSAVGEAEKLRRAYRLRDLCQQAGALFIVNNDPMLAQKTGANGVHLGQKDGDIGTARQLLGENAVIGVSCHNDIKLAAAAAAGGADYCALGAVFPSSTKPAATRCPLALLREVKQKTNLPVVAIGGITPENIGLVVDAGADAAASVAGLFNVPDRKSAALKMQNAFHTHAPIGRERCH